MRIVSADFIRAAESKKDYPNSAMKEIAFAGRSNVGKSSAINTLLGRRNLVRTSKTPGRTRNLNFFLINEHFFFVDLPGYGYAAVPQEIRRRWGPMIESYLTQRTQLAGVVLMLDARLEPTEADLGLMKFLQGHVIPFIVVVTKSDKLSRSQITSRKQSVEARVTQEVPVLIFSSVNGYGKNQLWNEIKKLIE